MSTIRKLSIPVGADLTPLNNDLKQAARGVEGFTALASVPSVPRLDLRGLRLDTARATALAGSVTRHVVENHVASKIAPNLSAVTNSAMLAKTAIDSQVGNAATLTIAVAQGSLKAGLTAAAATVRASMKVMTAAAYLPITVGSVALKVGFGLAEAFVAYKIKQMTGMSWVRLGVTYAAVRVGMAVTRRIVAGGVQAAARVAVIPVRVSLDALKAGLRTASAMAASAGRGVGNVAGMASPFGLAVAGGGALAGMAAGIGGAVNAASNLNEAVSKVGFSFGDAASVVVKGSEDMARRFGTPRREFLEAASGIGLIGKAAGLADPAAARLGVDFTKFAADVASFHNLSFEASLEKIRSGLVGEAEPLRTIGVLLSETAVKSQAAAMGFRAAGGHLTEGQKVQARAAIITAQLASAQGDLERTSSSLANRTRELWGRVQNLAADMGKFLLPAVESVSSAFAAALSGAGGFIESHKAVFEAWGAKLKAVADNVGVVLRNLGEVRNIVGLIAKDVAANAANMVAPLASYLKDYALYFGETVGRSVEDGITAALNATKPQASGWGKTVGKVVAFALNPAGSLTSAAGARAGATPGGRAALAGGALNAVSRAANPAGVVPPGVAAAAGAALGRAALAVLNPGAALFGHEAMRFTRDDAAKVGGLLGRGAVAAVVSPATGLVAALTGNGLGGPTALKNRPPLTPPTLRLPGWQRDAGIDEAKGRIAAAEALLDPVKRFAEKMLAVAGVGKEADRTRAAEALSVAASRVAGVAAGLPGTFQAVSRKALADDAARAEKRAEAWKKSSVANAGALMGAKKGSEKVTMDQVLKALGAGAGAVSLAGGMMAGVGGVGALAAQLGTQIKPPGPEKRFAGLAEAGSREAYSAVLKSQTGGGSDDGKRALKVGEDSLQVQRQQLAELRKKGPSGFLLKI